MGTLSTLKILLLYVNWILDSININTIEIFSILLTDNNYNIDLFFNINQKQITISGEAFKWEIKQFKGKIEKNLNYEKIGILG